MLSCFFWWILGHPLVVFVVSVGALGDVVLHVGSSVLGRLVGLGGLVRFSLLSVIVVLLVLWPFVFVGLSSVFSLLLVICVLVQVNFCLASIKLCL